MKKLNFNGLGQMLSRDQMKKVLGGDYGGGGGGGYYKCCASVGTISCSSCTYIPAGSSCYCSLGTCTSVGSSSC